MLFLPDMADVMPHTFTPQYKDESCFALAARGLLRLFTLRCGILRNADILDDEADFAPRRAAGCGGACPRAAWHRCPQRLFGGDAGEVRNDIQISGVLALGTTGAAAIISVNDDAPFTRSPGQRIDAQTRLLEVRQRSIVIERNSVKSEVFLPAPAQAPTIYMRAPGRSARE